MELKTALEKPTNTLVQQPVLHETSYEAYCLDDSSRVEFDSMIKLHSKSSNISTAQALEIIVGNRQVARSVCANKNSLTVMCKELSPRRPVSENIRTPIDEKGNCMYRSSESTRKTKRCAARIEIDGFRPTIYPLDSRSPMPPPSPLEL
jgi:hypothetical protein